MLNGRIVQSLFMPFLCQTHHCQCRCRQNVHARLSTLNSVLELESKMKNDWWQQEREKGMERAEKKNMGWKVKYTSRTWFVQLFASIDFQKWNSNATKLLGIFFFFCSKITHFHRIIIFFFWYAYHIQLYHRDKRKYTFFFFLHDKGVFFFLGASNEISSRNFFFVFFVFNKLLKWIFFFFSFFCNELENVLEQWTIFRCGLSAINKFLLFNVVVVAFLHELNLFAFYTLH